MTRAGSVGSECAEDVLDADHGGATGPVVEGEWRGRDVEGASLRLVGAGPQPGGDHVGHGGGIRDSGDIFAGEHDAGGLQCPGECGGQVPECPGGAVQPVGGGVVAGGACLYEVAEGD